MNADRLELTFPIMRIVPSHKPFVSVGFSFVLLFPVWGRWLSEWLVIMVYQFVATELRETLLAHAKSSVLRSFCDWEYEDVSLPVNIVPYSPNRPRLRS